MNFMLEAKLIDFHLDGLLNLPDITIKRCIKNDTKTILKVSFLTDYATCPRVHLTLENVSSGKLTIEISTAKRKNRGNALNIPLCSR